MCSVRGRRIAGLRLRIDKAARSGPDPPTGEPRPLPGCDEDTGISDELTEDLIQATGLALWIHDCVTGLNSFIGAWDRLVGLPADRISRDRDAYRSLVHPDDLPRFLDNTVARRAGEADAVRIEYRLCRPDDGRVIWIEDHGTVLRRGAAGEVLAVAGQCIDITRRKTAEGERDHAVGLLREAIDALPDGFVIYDAEDRTVLWNRRLLEMFPVVETERWQGAVTFAEKMRVGLETGIYPAAAGREEEWLEGVLKARAGGDSEFEIVLADGRVIRYRDRLLPSGFRVATRADLTALRAAEAKAHAADARLAAAVELLPDGFVALDRNDRYTSVNRRLLELFPQWRREDIIGKSYREVLKAEIDAGVYPVAVGREAEWLASVLAEREAAGEFFQREERQASGRWLRLVDRRLPSGERIGLRIDVTDLKVTAARLQAVLDGSGHAAWEWDVRSGAATMGAPWFAALGRDPAAFDGTLDGLRDSALAEDVAQLDRITREHLAGRLPAIDATMRHPLPDGRLAWFQVRGRIIERDRAGRPLKLAGVAIDVTEDRALRARLEEALAAAERASRAQLDLMARMSHDIRTPLNGVLGAISLLSSMVADPEQRRLIAVAEQSGEHLIALIDEILDLSRIETGRITVETAPVLLADLAEQIRAAHGILADRKGIELAVLCDAGSGQPRLGDRNRILEILHNLVGNAVKFTETGGVEVMIRAQPPGPVKITVRDSGPGMTEEELGRLFEPFVQANDSVAARYGGSGLGLSIVRKLAELMGGTVEAASRPGQGTTMTVALPLPMAADQRR